MAMLPPEEHSNFPAGSRIPATIHPNSQMWVMVVVVVVVVMVYFHSFLDLKKFFLLRTEIVGP